MFIDKSNKTCVVQNGKIVLGEVSFNSVSRRSIGVNMQFLNIFRRSQQLITRF